MKMKNPDVEKKINDLIGFMWRSQINLLKAREDLKEMETMFKKASDDLDHLQRLLIYLENKAENANQEPTKDTEKG